MVGQRFEELQPIDSVVARKNLLRFSGSVLASVVLPSSSGIHLLAKCSVIFFMEFKDLDRLDVSTARMKQYYSIVPVKQRILRRFEIHCPLLLTQVFDRRI